MELRLTTMELLPLVCLCLLTWSGTTFADGNGTEVIVLEGSDVTLPCSLSTRENIGLKRFVWWKDGGREVFLYESGQHSNKGLSGQDEKFKGRVSHFEDELKNGNASITIRDSKLTDSGNYTCEFPVLKETSHIKLVVGKAADPSVMTLNHTNDWALLQCQVKGASPKPLVQWQDSSGKIIQSKEPQVSARGGSYDIILQTKVTRTDHYHCVATQEEINHQIDAKTYVYISGEENNSGFPTGWVIGTILGVVVGVLLTLLVIWCCKKSKKGSRSNTI